MRKKLLRRRGVFFEPLESRQLLSNVVQPAITPDPAAVATQVQPAAQLEPTYEILSSDNGLTPLQTSGPQGYTPSEIRTAYGMDQVSFGAVAGDGSGQTIAIIDVYNDPTIQSDLRAFDAAFDLPNPILTVVSQTGSSTLPPVDPAGAGNDNWEGEEALDVEWAHAMAPGAKLILVEARDASPSNLFTAANWARSQPGVSVISMSFGGNETAGETQYDSIFTTPSGHEGVTFVASTGDSGAPAGYPALSPNVVAAGGTSLALDSLGNYQSETGWSGSGGSVSTVESQPDYQNGVVTQSTAFRADPDVAFVADPSTGVAVYDSYNNGTSKPWEILGGTSVAAPCWAGIFAVADQGRAIAGENTLDSSTVTLPLLYSAPASAFHDVITGNNGFAARAGYDLVTGRGSPVANLLIPYLVTGATPPPPPPPTGPMIASITANASTVTEGASITLTANGVSDPDSTGLILTFYQENNGVAGLQTDPTTGDFAFNPVTDGSDTITLDTTGATPGTYTFYAQLTDSSDAASPVGNDAPAVSVTVTAPGDGGPSIASVTADPNPVVTGDVLTLTANGVSDSQASVRRVYFYEETNNIPGLQTGRGGDFAFRPANAASGFSIELDTTGVTGSLDFYALAVDSFGDDSADGTAAPSVTVDIADDQVPAAPTALTAAPVSDSEIDLAFSEADSGQTGFTIQRSLDPNFATFTRLFTINRPDVLTYSDTDLTPGTRYYYRVEAFDIAGNSGFSNTASATTLAPATHLAIQQPPANVVAGQTISPVIVAVEDAQGRVVTDDTSSVTLALAPGSNAATLAGTLTVPVVDGVATFSDLSMTQAGSYTLVASDNTLTTALSSAFTVTPDVASIHLDLSQQPTDAVVARAMTSGLVVDLEDQFGNVITTGRSKITITIASGPDGAKLHGTVTRTDSKGAATFSNLSLSEPGDYTLQVTDGALAPVVTGSINVGYVPTHLVISRGPTSTIAGHTISTVTVRIEDVDGRIDTTNGSNVTIALATDPGNAALNGTLTVAAVNGIATFNDLTLTQTGSYRLTATDSVLASALSKTFSIKPDTSTAHLMLAKDPVTTLVEQKLNPGVVVDIEDQYGNIVTSNSSKIKLSVTIGPAGGKLTGTTALDAIRGIAAFNSLKLTEVGDYTLEAVDDSLPEPAPVSFDLTIAPDVVPLPIPNSNDQQTL